MSEDKQATDYNDENRISNARPEVLDQSEAGDSWRHRLLLRLCRAILFVGCVVMIGVTVISGIFISSRPGLTVYPLLECICLALLVVLGLYATIYGARESLMVYAVLCAVNSLLLIVALSAKVRLEHEPKAEALAPEARQQQQQHRMVACSETRQDCARSPAETCCPAIRPRISHNPFHLDESERARGNLTSQVHDAAASSYVPADEQTIHIFLWGVAGFNLIIALFAGLLGYCTPSPLEEPASGDRNSPASRSASRLRVKSPGAVEPVPASSLVAGAAGSSTGARLRRGQKPARRNLAMLASPSGVLASAAGARSSYQPQPVLVIGAQKDSRIPLSSYVAKKAAVSSSAAENSLDLRDATTRVEN